MPLNGHLQTVQTANRVLGAFHHREKESNKKATWENPGLAGLSWTWCVLILGHGGNLQQLLGLGARAPWWLP